MDGDTPLKTLDENPQYKDLNDRVFVIGEYAGKDREWQQADGIKPFISELARLALEAAKDSDTVVLSWACSFISMRSFLREQLLDAGAKDVSLVFLRCDFVAHMKSMWKRFQIQAELAGLTIDVFFKSMCSVDVTDFDSFVDYMGGPNGWCQNWQDPDDSEKPYDVVNVTARDMSVLDSLDVTFGIQENNRTDLSYEEIVAKIQAVDAERDRKWCEKFKEAGKMSPDEQEVAEKEPEKYAARRSTLSLSKDLEAIRRLSIVSDHSQTEISSKRCQSFLETGTFGEF